MNSSRSEVPARRHPHWQILGPLWRDTPFNSENPFLIPSFAVANPNLGVKSGSLDLFARVLYSKR